ncbi:MAG: ATP synthase subunit C [Candidatus Brocadiia bacterium]
MSNSRQIKRVLIAALLLAFVCASGIAGPAVALAQEEGGATTGETEAAPIRWDLSMAIAVAIAVPCLAAGYAVGKVGAAALGAASEKPELLARSLVFVALGEGLAIFGFLVALLLWLKL